MFILERLIGVGIYALLLLLVCLSLVGKSHKKIKRILFLYTVTLSILAFFYVPYETADLYRIYGFVEMFSKYSFSEMLQHQAQRGEWGIGNILYWVIGKTGIPQLLPALTTFVCYSCVFYIVNRTAKENNASGKNVAITLLFYMATGTYMSMISGIRCMLGISVFMWCFYRESVEGKFRVIHVPIYVFGALIHSFVAVLIALRFVLPVFDLKISALRRTIHLSLLGIGVVLSYRYMGGYLNQILAKAESYLDGSLYSYGWGYAIAILAYLILLFVLFEYRRMFGKIVQINKAWPMYLAVCLLGAVIFCYEYSVFARTILLVSPIICLPLMMSILQNDDQKKCVSKVYPITSIWDIKVDCSVIICSSSILLLLLSCARGSMCSLKFFVL